MRTFHFALHATFLSGFWYRDGLPVAVTVWRSLWPGRRTRPRAGGGRGSLSSPWARGVLVTVRRRRCRSSTFSGQCGAAAGSRYLSGAAGVRVTARRSRGEIVTVEQSPVTGPSQPEKPSRGEIRRAVEPESCSITGSNVTGGCIMIHMTNMQNIDSGLPVSMTSRDRFPKRVLRAICLGAKRNANRVA